MFSRRVVFLTAAILSMVAGLAWSQVETAPRPTIVGQEQSKALEASLIGEWTCEIGQVRQVLALSADGTFALGDKRGTYATEANRLSLRTDSDTVSYDFRLKGKTLTLSGGDLSAPLEFTKVPRFGETKEWLWDWSVPSLVGKLRRIGVIVLVVVVCQAAVRLLRILAQTVVYTEWGPLKFVYRRHKKRTMTLYSLALNISKYVIYLLAFGYILTELGVNYTMYFASLSVVGLAIGFGSQGLVQDMVTGFFIVFEEQFNVGDMVEIPPHTGIVEELGLRMTRLRNYLGQSVVIPNRNIAVVGNYVRGAQQVYLDVAIAPANDIEKARDALRRIAEKTAGQFQDIILSGPKSIEVVSLSSGERFLRLNLAIWPQQQWVIDQELTPRVRSVMKSEGFEIPNDKIVVFYHPRQARPLARRKGGNPQRADSSQ
ncbi:MAG: mechanosensitive ion channel [Sedimentisphaerales bacterium]|nr:mechanosensitive ion channel [Sedimentisphaerales bacterium]